MPQLFNMSIKISSTSKQFTHMVLKNNESIACLLVQFSECHNRIVLNQFLLGDKVYLVNGKSMLNLYFAFLPKRSIGMPRLF